ncbi:DUF2510 domain-containing protein [Curtobacterium sp. KT1]|uniref:DUF2510 domain-containing protein n=1 Tax=Curtobacterium sp. KT1 TaxID=3372858 RepID=UPI0037BEA618
MPVGWFPDPSDPGREMLWDGEKWTGLTRPRNEGAPAADREDSHRQEPTFTHSRRPGPRRRRLLLIGIIAAALVVLGGGGATAAVLHNQQVAAAEQKAAQKKATAARERAEQRQAEEAAQEAADDAERTARTETVTEVESSVKKMADDNVTKGLLDGPITGVSCNPVSGSTDDLTDTTTTFDCFAANKDNGDGTQSGYFFNATVNWDSGEYTYGLGKSGA